MSTILSIIRVNWNTSRFPEHCSASVLANRPTSQSADWVVDNASTDDSARMVCEKGPQLHRVEPNAPVASGALQAMLDFLDYHPEAAGARILNADGSLQISSHPRSTLSGELWRLFHLHVFSPYAMYPRTNWRINQSQGVDALGAACWLLKKTVLDQVGFLDEDYFIYSEEVDLCYRIQRAGWRLYGSSRAEVLHFGGQSTQQMPTEMFLDLCRSHIRCFHKHWGWPATLAYKLIPRIAAFARRMLTSFVIFEHSVCRQRHLTSADRYWRLITALHGM